MADIDNLEIKISADSSRAAENVLALADSLAELSTALSGNIRNQLNLAAEGIASVKSAVSGMNTTSDGIKKLSESLSEISAFKPIEGFDKIVKSLEPIKQISGIAHTITDDKSLSKAAQKLGDFISAVEIYSDAEVNTENLKSIADAMKSITISSENANSFASVSKAIKSLNGITVDESLTESLKDFISVIHEISDEDAERLKAVVAAADAFKGKKIDASIISDDAKKKTDELTESTSTLKSVFSGLASVINGVGSFLAKGAFTIATAEIKTLAATSQAAFSIIKSGMSGLSVLTKSVFAPFTALGKKLKQLTASAGQFLSSIKRIALYRAIRSAIKAISEGIKEGRENLYQYSLIAGTQFAKSMDMAATAFLYLKNSIGAATAPMTNYFVPILDKVIDRIVELINKFNELTAVMVGADTWTKALKYPIQWQEAADDANKSAKKLKSTMLGFDELNVIEPPTSGSKSKLEDALDYSRMFEEVRTDMESAFSLSEILIPIKMAWDDEGQKTLQHIKGTWESILGLIHSVKRDFKTIWMSGAGTYTLETILQSFQNILGTVGAIASGIQLAWDEGETGLNIIGNIWGTANNLLTVFNNIWASIRGMAEKVNWSPLLKSLESLFEALDRITNPSGGAAQLLQKVFDDIILPVGQWAIESGLPSAIESVAKAFDVLRGVFDNLNSNDTFSSAVESFKTIASLSFDNIKGLTESISNTVAELMKDESFAESLSLVVSIIGNIIGSVGGIAGGFKKAWDEGDNGTEIFKDIQSAAKNVLTIVNEIWSGVSEWASGVDWSPVINALGGLFDAIDKITNPDSGVATLLKGVFDNIIKPFASWIVKSGLPATIDLISVSLETVDNVLTSIQNNPATSDVLDFFTRLAGLTFEGITGLVDSLSVIQSILFGTEIPDSVAERLENSRFSSGKFADFMKQSGYGLYDWINQFNLDENGLLIGDGNDAFTQFRAFFATLNPINIIASEWGDDIGEKLKTWMNDNVIAPIKERFDDWIDFPDEVGEKIGKKVREAWEALKKDIKNILGIKNNSSSQTKELGKDISNGMLNGVSEPFNNISTWIQNNIFDPFVNGFKSLFKIGSPSKVMEENGEYITDGLLNGIKSKFSISSITEWVRSNLFAPFSTAFKNAFGIGSNGESAVGKDIGAAITTGIGSGITATFDENVSGEVGKKRDLLKQFFRSDEFEESGENIVKGIGAGFNDQGNYDRNIGQWILEKVGWIQAAFASENFVGAGEAIGAGIGQGIRNSKEAFAAAMQYMLQGDSDTAQYLLMLGVENMVTSNSARASLIKSHNYSIGNDVLSRSESRMSALGGNNITSGIADAVYRSMVQANQTASKNGGQIPNINLYIDRKELTTQVEEQQKSNGVNIFGTVAYQ